MQIKQKLQFLFVGGFAFLVDATSYILLSNLLTMSPLSARIVAFSLAVSVTCAGNRYLTFGDRQHKAFYKQYGLALVAGLVSLVPNLMVFLGMLFVLPTNIMFEMLAFMGGTTAGVVSNYILSEHIVFA